MLRGWPGLFLVAALALAAAACGADAEGEDLDPYLCTQEDVGEQYQELTRGNFSPRDLADLGRDAGRRADEFRAAGMERGRFVLYKQSLPKPPFEPPFNVMCQVLEFESDGAARTWIEQLDPEAALAVPAIAWIPDEPWEVTEPSLGFPRPGLRIRAFEVRAGSGAQGVAARFHVANEGRFVSVIGRGRTAAEITNDDREVLNGLLVRRAARLREAPPRD